MGIVAWTSLIASLIRSWKTGGLSGTSVDEYKYGYDADGNATYRQNAGIDAAALDEFYQYDGLNRLDFAQRGTLNTYKTAIGALASGSMAMNSNWDVGGTDGLDGLGNFASFSDNGTTQTHRGRRQRNHFDQRRRTGHGRLLRRRRPRRLRHVRVHVRRLEPDDPGNRPGRQCDSHRPL